MKDKRARNILFTVSSMLKSENNNLQALLHFNIETQIRNMLQTLLSFVGLCISTFLISTLK